jgi:hypothetical protein
MIEAWPMRKWKIMAVCAMLIGVLGGCLGSGEAANKSDERLRVRVGAFYSAWKNNKMETIRRLVSQNFRDNDPGLAALEEVLRRTRIASFQPPAVEDELNMKRVVVKATTDAGATMEQTTYWKYERGDWYLEVLD